MSCEQPPETLNQNDIRDKSRPLSKAGDAEPSHPEDIVQHDAGEDVEKDVSEPDAKVPPPLAVVNIARGEELIRRRERTVLAATRRTGIVQLSRCPGLQVLGQVLSAGLTRRWIEYGQFIPRTLHTSAV